MKKLVLFLLAAIMLLTPMMISAEGPVEVAVIIKATTSDFWQYVLVGAENYGKEFPDRVHITTYGPPSEADIDEQVSILENVVSTNPAAIVIASTSSDATIPALLDAQSKGIVVITIDNKLNEDCYDSFLATNNYIGGGLAAEQMVATWKELGIEPAGKVGLVNAMAGVQVLINREQGFRDKLAELAPNVVILETRFTDNDMVKSITAAEDMVSANADLIGLFGCNNVTGDGVARVIGEQGLSGKIVGIAFDSDPEEIAAIDSGALKALILQDPYGMGYKGVNYAWEKLTGKEIPKEVDTGATVVTKVNFSDPAIQGLLDPTTLKLP
jgi:ribose transport system substrate-binding protein